MTSEREMEEEVEKNKKPIGDPEPKKKEPPAGDPKPRGSEPGDPPPVINPR